MTNFVPGKIIKHFKTKDGKELIIRYPKWEDLDSMVSFINAVSLEDTYITFSGEPIYKDGEMHYLSEMMKTIEGRSGIYLGCYYGDRFVGSATVLRDLTQRKRSYHIGIFGITIAKDFRGIGLGEELAKQTLEEARKYMEGLKLFTLNMYSPNNIALHLYKKLGFVEYGRLPKGIWYKGTYVDEIKMQMPA